METGVTIYKPKSAVAIRREMAAIPAVMGALGPVEKAVFLASTAKTVAEHDGRELAAELAKALRFIAKDVGYRDTDENERGYLVVRVCEILKRYYGGLTIKDFKMAFEMSITGELDEYLPKGRDGQADRGHYQQFNAEYVCKILNAYKYRRAAVLKKANDAMPPEPEKPMDAQESRRLRNATKSECIKAFEYFKENGRLPEMSPIGEMLYYQLLADVGLAREIVVTVDEQKVILQRTINQLAAKGMVGDIRRLKDAGTDAPDIQHGAFTLARKKALKAAFERMVADGIEITDYIKLD